MDSSSFCLVLTGRLAAGQDAAAVQARLARAFGMDEERFAGQVFGRAPLVIRDGLDQPAAREQAARLFAAGAEADVLPDDGGRRVWLLHAQRVCGPLPAAALARYARPGDAWCRDGEERWQDWDQAAHPLPPPLPAATTATAIADALPPPLPTAIHATAAGAAAAHGPAVPPPAPRRPSRQAVAVLLVAVLLGLAWWWSGRPQPSASRSPAPAAAPPAPATRPAAPVSWLPDRGPASHCAVPAGTAPASDEDRFLAAGGHRRLTGRHLRQGDTYVAEAALGFDDDCRFDPLQLYVFRAGVFIGTALSAPAWREDGRRILDFELAGEQALHYRVSDCGNDADCDRAVAHTVQLVRRDFGWSLERDEAEAPPTPPKILSRTMPPYPPAAMSQRHQGQVLLQIGIGRDGLPGEIRVLHSSGYAELDQAAVAAARQWRFQPASRNGKPVVARARVPVNFVLDRS